ncbi:hypothetical protein LCGC14_1873650, partial [marine sediment metagenome]
MGVQFESPQAYSGCFGECSS